MASQKGKAELESLMLRYLSVFAPQGEFEKFLVEMMVQARWSLTQMQRLEQSGKLSEVDRKSAERSYRRAHKALSRLRKQPLPLGPAELKTLARMPIQPDFPDLGDFALRS